MSVLGVLKLQKGRQKMVKGPKLKKKKQKINN